MSVSKDHHRHCIPRIATCTVDRIYRWFFVIEPPRYGPAWVRVCPRVIVARCHRFASIYGVRSCDLMSQPTHAWDITRKTGVPTPLGWRRSLPGTRCAFKSVASREIPVIEGVQGGFTRAKDGKLGITLVLARSVVPLCARPRCCCSCSLSFASS